MRRASQIMIATSTSIDGTNNIINMNGNSNGLLTSENRLSNDKDSPDLSILAAQNLGPSDKITVKPTPGFVIKTRRESGIKVFVNVCEHEEVPIPEKKKGHKKWPVMVLGGVFRESVDKAAETCLVLDVIVNPSIIQECNADKSGETKEEVCVRVIDALRAREKERYPDGPPGGVLDKTFSLPKLSKHYKGDSIVSMDIPATIAVDKKHQNIFEAVRLLSPEEIRERTVLATQALNGETVNGGGEGTEQSRRGSFFGGGGGRGPKGKFKSVALLATTSAGRELIQAATIPKRCFAYSVVRKVGAVIKQRPDKNSPKVRSVLEGGKIYVYAKKRFPDDTVWYRAADGWTASYTEGGQRMLRPISDNQPLSAKVKGMRFVEIQKDGWLFATKIHKTILTIELSYPRDTILRILRSIDEVKTLQEELNTWINDSDPTTQARFREKVCLVSRLNDSAELLTNVDTLIEVSEGVEVWLCHVLQCIDSGGCTPLQTFLHPSEADCVLMETDLQANHGLDGAYPNYDQF
eukprot:CAMPEP_0174821854 /NCGR_PEP_ID=MMETSP1107-20130205/10470_1 /TAXON_ID=36770 /ORGANISM="Paraphysomonas vestita, Strain GFlagA" /LENGTH=521 /DNA_ID=CAMNT_0016039357 /DNA_START=441 /DNA_END=2006 /DNA_ORIENTATION=-